MSRLLIVADDLTGANDSVVQFVKHGMKAATMLRLPETGCFRKLETGFEVLAFSTESRNVGPEEAEELISRYVPVLISEFSPRILFKKIDSTLRGNVGVEVMRLRQYLGGSSIPVLVAPGYPSNRRVVVGGYVLVEGTPLARTYAGRDALAPVRTSRVSNLFSRWAQEVGSLELSEFEAGEDAVAKKLSDLLESGKTIVVIDSLSQSDLDLFVRIARSVTEKALWVGSAGLAQALAGSLGATLGVQEGNTSPGPGRFGLKCGGKCLVLYGSLNPAAKAQVQAVESTPGFRVIHVSRELDAAGVSREVLDAQEKVVVVTSFEVRSSLPTDEMAARVKAFFTEIAVNTVGSGGFSSLILSGGDVARAVLEGLGCQALSVETEVLPGVVFGRVVGGPHAGLGIVTKAGGFGDRGALMALIRRIYCQEET